MTATIIAAIFALLMIISVLFKPYLSLGKFKVGLYVIVCLLGAVAELIFGGLPISDAVSVNLVNILDIQVYLVEHVDTAHLDLCRY